MPAYLPNYLSTYLQTYLPNYLSHIFYYPSSTTECNYVYNNLIYTSRSTTNIGAVTMALANHVTLIAQVRPKHLSLDTNVTFVRCSVSQGFVTYVLIEML